MSQEYVTKQKLSSPGVRNLVLLQQGFVQHRFGHETGRTYVRQLFNRHPVKTDASQQRRVVVDAPVFPSFLQPFQNGFEYLLLRGEQRILLDILRQQLLKREFGTTECYVTLRL